MPEIIWRFIREIVENFGSGSRSFSLSHERDPSAGPPPMPFVDALDAANISPIFAPRSMRSWSAKKPPRN